MKSKRTLLFYHNFRILTIRKMHKSKSRYCAKCRISRKLQKGLDFLAVLVYTNIRKQEDRAKAHNQKGKENEKRYDD